jgi:MFS transporter, PPP family, 3-phenylpropionic acid transporter
VLSPPLWGALADTRMGSTRLLRMNTWLSAIALLGLTQPLDFVSTLVLFAVWALFSSSLMPLAEASTYRLLTGQTEKFSFIRVWGSIGFAVSAGAMGVIGLGDQARMPFVIGTVSYVLAALVAARLPEARAESKAPLFRSVHGLAKRPDVALLWLASGLYYAAHGAYDSYFGPHVAALASVGAEAVSYAWGLGVLCEVAILFTMPALLRRFGATPLLVFSALVAALRWFLLAHVSTALHVWLLAPLHGVTYGVWYLAFVHDNQAGAPTELRATVQGLGAACLALGHISSILIGARVFQELGGTVLFEAAGTLALASLVLYALRGRVLARAARPVAAAVEGA